ncbi:hypothetical protein P170DRAFT_426225 [Aspergillus steynii IBT 23096]|uniref:DUF7580 domain-containing protein n=1 Tax=Aspergillus steynii IBT 23096 TaxID=1392250 RepID=A0A2I2G8T2_9EURO|nr:uncharacterized protein P170DRAFT_426225 [Aspergillus steynii IBT 23096]PLB49281.1 hypothetical protein P170DRAFT_426225 [Aspergillus steynii IBT 23096]
MLTTVEGAGITIAVFSLLLQLIPLCIRGSRVLKSLRHSTHKYELQEDQSLLDDYQRYLTSTVKGMIGLPSPVPDVDIANFCRDPGSALRRHPSLVQSLQGRLGQNRISFISSMQEAQRIMDRLSDQLNPGNADDRSDQFDELEKRIKLMERLASPPVATYSNPRLELLLPEYREARKIASTIHDVLLHGNFWGCRCGNHCIDVILCHDIQNYEGPKGMKLRIDSPTTVSDGATRGQRRWQEVKVDSAPNPTGGPTASMTSMCSMLTGPHPAFGYLSDSDYRHEISITGAAVRGLQLKSLEDIVQYPCVRSVSAENKPIFSAKSRFHFAGKLACAALQFHGNWLPKSWSSRDIAFLSTMGSEESLRTPFLARNTSSVPRRSYRPATSAMLKETLISLGWSLAELSFCSTIQDLPYSKNEVLGGVKKKEFLRDISEQSGERYRKVVKQCLFWPDDHGADDMFRKIVIPLLDIVRTF